MTSPVEAYPESGRNVPKELNDRFLVLTAADQKVNRGLGDGDLS
jgi:hypothetical protein